MKPNKYSLVYHEGFKKYLAEGRCAFHMPGHKGRYLTQGISTTILPKELFFYDITASYDREDLYNPKTFLKKSLENVRTIYNSIKSFYLVNGSTGGNQAALIATLNPGDKILMSRNVHKLIFGALVVTQAEPVYMEFSSHQNSQPLMSCIDPKTIETTLKSDPKIKVVYLVNPTYVGVCSNIAEIIRIAHQYNKIVVVDEAHGAHFFFHPELPISAITAGADIVIQSPHKTLNAMSQTALLHICSNRVDSARVEQVINMFQTTSPNTILLLSLESAIVQMANQGYHLLNQTLEYARKIRNSLKNSSLICINKNSFANSFVGDLDETKLYIDISLLGLNGYEVKNILSQYYKIEAELADDKHILFTFTIADSIYEMKKIEESLLHLSNQTYAKQSKINIHTQPPPLPIASRLTPAQTFYAQHEDIPLTKSAGRICAEMITAYPPGIPILMPGEIITKEIIEYLVFLIELHANFGSSKYNDLSHIVVTHHAHLME